MNKDFSSQRCREINNDKMRKAFSQIYHKRANLYLKGTATVDERVV